jgi:predicted  nucleic acid-binding Zn-ribbon protein
MAAFLTILVLVSALVALVTGVSALWAGLRLRRTGTALRTHLYSEIDRLARRSTELEESLAALDARAQTIPVRVSELQQNLAALRVLTSALGSSLRRSRRVLSSDDTRLSRDEGNGDRIYREREDESPEP